MAAMDERFELLFTEARALRPEMNAGFLQVRGEIAAVRSEIAAVRAELVASQRHANLILAGFAVGLLGLLSAGQF